MLLLRSHQRALNSSGFTASALTELLLSCGGNRVEAGGPPRPGVVLCPREVRASEVHVAEVRGPEVRLDGRSLLLTAVDPEFRGAPAPGIGFAIPSDAVRSIASSLIQSN